MRLRTERSNSPSRRALDAVVEREVVFGRLGAGDFDELELNAGVGHEACPRRRRLALVWIGGAEVLVEGFNLAIDLRGRDVLLCRLVDHIDDGLYGDDLGCFQVDAALALSVGRIFEAHLIRAIRRKPLEQQHVSRHGPTSPLQLGASRSLGLLCHAVLLPAVATPGRPGPNCQTLKYGADQNKRGRGPNRTVGRSPRPLPLRSRTCRLPMC